MSNTETLLKETDWPRMGFPLVLPGFKILTQSYLRPYCKLAKKSCIYLFVNIFLLIQHIFIPLSKLGKDFFYVQYTQYLTSICFSKHQDVHTKEFLAKVSKVNWFELICTELGNFVIVHTRIFVLLQFFVISIKVYCTVKIGHFMHIFVSFFNLLLLKIVMKSTRLSPTLNCPSGPHTSTNLRLCFHVKSPPKDFIKRILDSTQDE